MAKPFDLRERTFQFGTNCLDLAIELPQTPEAKFIREQFMRSASSVGANVEEGDGAETRPDKKKSFVIARKETRETRFWLRMIHHRWGKNVPSRPLIAEASELILSRIIKNMS